MHDDDEGLFSIKGIVVILAIGAFVYWLITSPPRKEKKTHFIYQYDIGDDSPRIGRRYVITSIDTSYGDEQDGVPNYIGVGLSPE